MFAIPVVRVASADDVFAWSRTVREVVGGCSIVGAETTAGREVWSHDFRGATIVVAGSERPGLSRAYREQCDALVTIPMSGSVSSVNVSVATSIVLYEIARQRRSATRKRGARRLADQGGGTRVSRSDVLWYDSDSAF